MGLLEDKQRARIFYKYLSRIYDTINPYIWTEEMRSEAIEMLDIPENPVILDVGCGTGFATEALIQHSSEVYGLDQSIHQLRQAQKRLDTFDFLPLILGDAERLPFPSDSFDIVWSSGSIEYWPNPIETLAELRRVTNSGGQVLIVGPHKPSNKLFESIADKIMLFYNKSEADHMFRQAGFTDFTHQTMGPWYNPNIAIT
ncbi:MAG: methyltransferase domain-containing protein, partial [Halobacteriaceae archaeon]